jgi:hypothetical protein
VGAAVGGGGGGVEGEVRAGAVGGRGGAVDHEGVADGEDRRGRAALGAVLAGAEHGPQLAGQLVEVDGLDEVVDGAEAHGLDGGRDQAGGREHEHVGVDLVALDRGEQLHAADVRHVEVGEHEVDVGLLDLAQAVGAVDGGLDRVAELLEVISQGLAGVGVILDDEDRACLRRFGNHPHRDLIRRAAAGRQGARPRAGVFTARRGCGRSRSAGPMRLAV